MSAPLLSKKDGYVLRLYISGNTPKSLLAERNLRELCEEYVAGRYHLEVIDLSKDPKRARDDQVIAVPTIIRELPVPIRKFIGTLSNPDRVLVEFDLRPNEASLITTQEGSGHAP